MARVHSQVLRVAWQDQPEKLLSIYDTSDTVTRHEAANPIKLFVISAGYPYASHNSTDTTKVV